MNRIEFEKKWLNTFIPNLTDKQYNDCFVEQYLWHIFSYELIPKENVLTGDMASVNTDELVHTARSSSACFPVFQCTLSAA